MDKIESQVFAPSTEGPLQPFSSFDLLKSQRGNVGASLVDFANASIDFTDPFKQYSSVAESLAPRTHAKAEPQALAQAAPKAAEETAATAPAESKNAIPDINSRVIPDDADNAGFKKLRDFFYSKEVRAVKDKDGQVDLAALKSVNAAAQKEGRADDLAVGEFVEKHFSELANLHHDRTFFSDKKLSAKDILSVSSFDALFDAGKMPARFDSRFNQALQLGGAVVGAALGGALQLGIERLPGGKLIETAGLAIGNTFVAPAGGFAGYLAGAALSEKITGKDDGYLSYPLTIGGVFAGGALGLNLGTKVWGPAVGAVLGYYAVTAFGDKLYHSAGADNYKRMSAELRNIR